MFLSLTIAGCGILIPVHIAFSNSGGGDCQLFPISTGADPVTTILSKMTPIYVCGSPMWAHVVVSYLFDAIVMFFLWWNYRVIVRLKRNYFQSPEYQQSLHSRSIWMTDIPAADRSDEGILRIADAVEQTSSIPRAAIARNVKELPKLIQEHNETVRKLESVLAKYLKNPDQLPPNRPTIRPSKKDHRASSGVKIDAIDYLTGRIKDLETDIKDVRESIDKRNPMPYGFATYERIEEAHAVAYEGKKKKPTGVRIRLAPKPNDLIWDNLPLGRAVRSRKRWTINFWFVVLTIIWVVPNALIAVFLSNLNNLKGIWPAFKQSYEADPGVWEAVQAILAPALLSGIYLALPVIFRRLSTQSGDLTKTSRERHVLHKLYAFFVFNNLIVFSIFSTLWKFVVAVTDGVNSGHNDPWTAIREANLPRNLLQSLCTVSSFWFIWLIQRNLGAAIDLSQLVALAWKWFSRTFMHPTPRESIEWTAPPAFDYASYYNWFLFYVTVAVSFATVQPLVLLVTFMYFLIDSWLKKYLLLYVFITKTESGGQFWNVLFNRILFLTFLGNCVAALVIKGAGGSWVMLGVMVPLPFAVAGFKWYCSKNYANQCRYYTTNVHDIEGASDPVKKARKQEKIGIKFGHPALYKPLITPMVHAKAKHVLTNVYGGRLEQDGTNYGYSDIAMDPMSQQQPGKPARFSLGNQKNMFEVVSENDLDFQNFKNRADFASEHGGDGELYGRPIDLVSERSQTPKSFMTSQEDLSRSETHPPMPGVRQQRPDELQYHPAFRAPTADAAGDVAGSHNGSVYNLNNDSDSNLLRGAQYPAGYTPIQTNMPNDSREALGLERWRTGGSAYAGTNGQDTGYEPYRPGAPHQNSFRGV